MIKPTVLLNLLACVLGEFTYSTTYTEVLKVQPSTFPFMASFSVEGLYEDTHLCSATIIHPEWAVTTADCVLRKGLGQPILSTGSSSLISVCRNDIVAIVIHPLYAKIGDSSTNDIALLRIEDPIEPKENIGTIAIGALKIPADCSVIGWGVEKDGSLKTDLQSLFVNIAGNEFCYAGYSGPENMCALGRECFGDSGGPLVCGNELVGLVSRGVKGCTGSPEAFTKVEHHREWIDFVINGTQSY